MTVYLCVNHSENNAINKNITTLTNVNAVVKGDISLLNPVLILHTETVLENINYMYIPEYERYYFITDVHPTTGNRIQITGKVDVLESFKQEILSTTVILESTENIGKSNYLPSPVWVNEVKSKTDIITFPNGMLETGEYILITAGGGN